MLSFRMDTWPQELKRGILCIGDLSGELCVIYRVASSPKAKEDP